MLHAGQLSRDHDAIRIGVDVNAREATPRSRSTLHEAIDLVLEAAHVAERVGAIERVHHHQRVLLGPPRLTQIGPKPTRSSGERCSSCLYRKPRLAGVGNATFWHPPLFSLHSGAPDALFPSAVTRTRSRPLGRPALIDTRSADGRWLSPSGAGG